MPDSQTATTFRKCLWNEISRLSCLQRELNSSYVSIVSFFFGRYNFRAHFASSRCWCLPLYIQCLLLRLAKSAASKSYQTSRAEFTHFSIRRLLANCKAFIYLARRAIEKNEGKMVRKLWWLTSGICYTCVRVYLFESVHLVDTQSEHSKRQ